MDRFVDLAALHALGCFDPEERTAFENALASAPAGVQQEALDFAEAAQWIGLAAPPADPPAQLRERLMSRIHDERLKANTNQSQQVWKQWQPASAQEAADLLVVRQGDDGWQLVREGVWAKQLYVDNARDMATMLIRMEPGAAYVPHRHAGPEQCFVLDGDLHDGQQVYRKGDFQCAAEGSTHGVQWSEQGCTLLIVSSLHDQVL